MWLQKMMWRHFMSWLFSQTSWVNQQLQKRQELHHKVLDLLRDYNKKNNNVKNMKKVYFFVFVWMYLPLISFNYLTNVEINVLQIPLARLKGMTTRACCDNELIGSSKSVENCNCFDWRRIYSLVRFIHCVAWNNITHCKYCKTFPQQTLQRVSLC